MLDIKFIRENKDIVQAGAKKKHTDIDIEKLVTLDDERLKELKEVEDLRAEVNRVSNDISRNQDSALKIQLIEEMRIVKEDIKVKEGKLKEIITEWQVLMLQVPNVPDMSVPEGSGEDENKELRTWGEKPVFSFEPKDHIEIMTKLDMADFERGVKAHGFRGYFLKNDGALLSWAIWNYAQEFFLKKNFSPFIPPVILNKEHFFGTGHLPGGAEDIFQTQDGQYLAGTAEVPMMAYHASEILSEKDLPKRYLAFSPCFRREAGAHSKDVKGLIRVHEFYKLEQLVLCKASHEESVKFHEELNRNTEEFIESLGIPYRQVVICTGDLKGAHVKSYDTELWVPKEGKYREIASASYYHDFQTRRFGIRYRDQEGKIHYAHSLNATAIPTPRILVSLIENYQQADGSIKIPEVLRKYLGGKEFIK
ncbi:serine--tRNA ligase [Candidatus Nomurabacteria bacterium RIFCSPLOWO2_02_40_28]|uniref:Serine--tRNA ligase n=2 Tax=Candidatus Nomuraibacteriota TaxID=1752729 RepID=A0A837HV31_9BACT|nr:MAG: Serine-tRNA ligase [Candidatus Nomurabacteria bacterium GW2011_GWD2_39_12]KKR20979.1 MAG: Serine-tRNA ligase [Candidatus Nomurabacteria bacterium GW2011_GWC2_39_41]KKR36981.1 MAG: Serine-tRNA ligase [Candidatus Nomurabacteria bacterium GW2011_GWE2_40_10]KKR38928.1 MAG: Serine-tRNA ligase [Candidatus Nomurabacteria bacterium GW2011_GWB1_40_11]KKR40170.1 MAG: Serine-tRNA ligase [Parcubacteria group bacterium GW2011_GWC1_40_11]KKR59315.1 MAG: Serine-tRNA ligase [Candidatus Nomurabacteria 